MIARRLSWIAAAACLASMGPLALAKGGPKSDPKSDPKAGGMPGQINDTVELAGNWIYDDVDKGFTEAKKASKPICFVFR